MTGFDAFMWTLTVAMVPVACLAWGAMLKCICDLWANLS